MSKNPKTLVMCFETAGFYPLKSYKNGTGGLFSTISTDPEQMAGGLTTIPVQQTFRQGKYVDKEGNLFYEEVVIRFF